MIWGLIISYKSDNMKRKLYIVEGLPCTGKSTAAKFVAEKTGGIYVDEGNGNHPADYEFQAFIPDRALGGFSEDEKEILLGCAVKRENGIIVPLSELKDELFEKALKFKIYDFLDWETERGVMLDKWREFAENCGEKAYVFNCVFLQNPMCETMMRFNFDVNVSFNYINEICRITAPLEPLIIYLKNDNEAESVKNAVKERGGEWLNAVVDYHCNGGYGKANGLSGFDGYIKALEERQRRELEILAKLPVKSIVIDNPQRDYEQAYKKIEEVIK